MVISKTPLRTSFVGGGSDLPSFAEPYGGAVVTTAIDKYVYVVVNERFEDEIRVSYSETEIVETASLIKHELIREALATVGVTSGVEVVTIADIPGGGTGLGSSSAVTIGTLNALFAYKGVHKWPEELASLAARIEIDVLEKPIGAQDHYASALGGLRLIRFGPGRTVRSETLFLTDDVRSELDSSLLMFYTGRQRSAGSVLTGIQESVKRESATRAVLTEMRDLALELAEALQTNADVRVFGEFLHRNWELKRQLPGVSMNRIDRWYEGARSAGAVGGKLLGAGGGGFLLFVVPRECQESVRAALGTLREVSIGLESRGSRIVRID
jgi:D-glycero-alpha-D-manno-heptose-7-phosphate kinase